MQPGLALGCGPVYTRPSGSAARDFLSFALQLAPFVHAYQKIGRYGAKLAISRQNDTGPFGVKQPVSVPPGGQWRARRHGSGGSHGNPGTITVCNLQDLEDLAGFESHSLRQ